MKRILLSIGILSMLFVFPESGIVKAIIVSQPQSITVCESSSATISFSVTSSNFLPSYQWQQYSTKLGWVNLSDNKDPFSGIVISGSNSATISFGFSKWFPLNIYYSGTQIRCYISSKEISAAALTTVVPHPSILSHPESIERVVDQSASFIITASGSGLSYQWQVDQGSGFKDISGAQSSSYNIKYVSPGDAGTYRCMVSNGICSPVSSNGAVLNVYPYLVIDKHPSKKSGCENSTATFSISASNAIAYQWEVLPYKSEVWEIIKEATASTYQTDQLTPDMNGFQFRCVVFGGAGQTETSYAGILTVYSNVFIFNHPAGASKTIGESVTFNVSAGGLVNSYQWQFNGTPISGANSSSYTIGSVQLSDAGAYRCVVSGCITAISNDASLTVTAPTYPNGWYKQTSGSGLNILSVAPVTDLKVWAVSYDADQLLKTTDGGKNWTSVSTGYSGNWQSICFPSENVGMVGGWNGLSRTTNGGSNWAYIDIVAALGLNPSTDYFYIFNFHFRDALNGWAVGSNGLIIKTTDGGATWTRAGYKTGVPKVTDVDLYSVHFLDANTGFVGGINGILFKTINGGASWTELTSSVTSSILDITFVNGTKGFFATSSFSGSLYSTTNGGTSWTKNTIPGTNNLIYSVDFTDANNGWAAGSYYDFNTSSYPALILKTYNGGQSWVPQKTDNPSEISEIRMYNAEHGWAVGKAGKIYRTGKGGCYDPVVSLYADQTLCANQNYTLVADTFINNYNSRYSWSTGSTAGSINVNATANYSVTITNECGVSATDNATITFLPLPIASAGADVSICAGESTQLLATGGSSYSWNNSGYLNDNLISNPVATPPIGSTVFTVTVTDANACVNTDNLMVTVNPIPASDFTAPVYLCGTANGSFTYSGSATGKTFSWDFSGGTIASGSNGGPLQVNWNSLGDKLVSLTTTENNCSSPATLKIVNVREKPSSDFQAPVATCGSSPAVLIYTGSAPSNANYSWSLGGGTITAGIGQGPIQVAWPVKGTKAVSLTVTQNQCVSDVTSHNIIVSYPYEGEKICLVTIDLETGKNMVVWEKTKNVGIASYNVYREKTDQGGVYDIIGTVNFNDLSLFVDLTSNPENRQYLYKISAVDTCGNESSLSKYHKTLFLQYVGTSSGVNLNWQPYQIENGTASFTGYALFKGSTSSNLSEFTTISSSVFAYTDTDATALSNKTYYRIGGILANPCDPADLLPGKKASSGPYVHSLSNLEDNRLQSTGIKSQLNDALSLNVYPSPFTDFTTINFELDKPTKMKVEVYNVVGEKVIVLLDGQQDHGVHRLELKASEVNNLSGLYYIRITADDAVIVKKTMLTR